MNQVIDFIQTYSVWFVLGLTCMSIILLIYTLIVHRGVRGIRKRRLAKLEDGRVGDIIDCLTEQFDTLSSIQNLIEALQANQSEQGKKLEKCFQKAGVVRFNAFEDVGGEQSFSLALLDSDDNGLVVSSLYGRQDSRLYVKKIANGESDRAVSEEERKAIEKTAE